MNKRILIPVTAIGKRVVLVVQGNGNVVTVKNKAGDIVASAADPNLALEKKIFNFKANSGIAMASERNRQILIDAVKAEKAGDADKAHKLYNDYLNAVQLSAGILLPSASADKMASGVEIAATIQQVTTDNGSLLTIDPSTISVVEPERYGATTFDMDAILGGVDDEDDDDANSVEDVLGGDEFTSMDRDALKAYIKTNNLKEKVKVTNKTTDEEIRVALREALASIATDEEEDF